MEPDKLLSFESQIKLRLENLFENQLLTAALLHSRIKKGQLRESRSPKRAVGQLGGSKSTPMCIYKF